jgi:hypothetical protein
MVFGSMLNPLTYHLWGTLEFGGARVDLVRYLRGVGFEVSQKEGRHWEEENSTHGE